jgi:hypothetical protein
VIIIAEHGKQDAVTKYFRHPLVLEATKISYDWIKNLTTLSTASILILAALIDRVFSAPVGIWLVYLALLSFMLTILGSIYAMFAIVELLVAPSHLGYAPPSEIAPRWVVKLGNFVFRPQRVVPALMATVLSFIIGIVLIVIFVLLNVGG